MGPVPAKRGIQSRLLGRDPESREVAEYQIIVDPGSPPAPRDLAGMTNYDTDTNGHGTEAVMEKIVGALKNIELFLAF
jgi:hypothetical protein